MCVSFTGQSGLVSHGTLLGWWALQVHEEDVNVPLLDSPPEQGCAKGQAALAGGAPKSSQLTKAWLGGHQVF